MTNPSFTILSVPVNGDVILAPMDGLSDQPFRSLARRLGSAMTYTEFLCADDIIHHRPGIERRFAFEPAERPIAFQILDNDPQHILEAALVLEKFSPDVMDVNLGCSSRHVSQRGSGSGMLREPQKIAAVFNLLTRNLAIPVSAKIRLGWDDNSRNYMEVAHIIEDNGGSLLAVHGRTRHQAYAGSADWNAIAEVCSSVSIPVIANGDVRSVADIARLKEHTGCAAVMIGRAAIGNPWIFSRRDRAQISPTEVMSTMQMHLEALLAFYGSPNGLVLFRKFARAYLSPYHPDPEFFRHILTGTDPKQFIMDVRQYLETIDFPSPGFPSN